jgi:LEA14-like dessication related protein
MKNRISAVIGFSGFLLFCFHCSELQQLARISKPRLNVAGVRMTGLSLQAIDLTFDIDIDNPNPLSVSMGGFDYDLQINNTSFLKGVQEQKLVIQSSSQSRVELPLTLTFEKLFQTYQTLKNSDSTDYTILCGFTFELPVLGPTRIPVTKSGNLPLIKLPNFRIHTLRLNRFNVTGADLTLEIKMDNPNYFQLLLNQLNYRFSVNGLSWATGNLSTAQSVNEKESGTIELPISLNFIDMGRTVFQLISGSQPLNYQFTGNLEFDTTLPLLKDVSFPVSSSGSLPLTK